EAAAGLGHHHVAGVFQDDFVGAPQRVAFERPVGAVLAGDGDLVEADRAEIAQRVGRPARVFDDDLRRAVATGLTARAVLIIVNADTRVVRVGDHQVVESNAAVVEHRRIDVVAWRDAKEARPFVGSHLIERVVLRYRATGALDAYHVHTGLLDGVAAAS